MASWTKDGDEEEFTKKVKNKAKFVSLFSGNWEVDEDLNNSPEGYSVFQCIKMDWFKSCWGADGYQITYKRDE